MAINATRESAFASARAASRRPAALLPLLLLPLPILVMLTARPAAADDTVDACAEASEKGQELRDKGKLRDARELLVKCAADACPKVIRGDCAEWLATVESKMPSIVVRARDAQGRDQANVRVLCDDKEIAKALDGRALSIDPGEHTLRFEQPGSEAVQQSLLVREGEKNRLVDVVLGATAAPVPVPPPPSESGAFRIPVASWILAGVAVLGGAGFTYFGLRAKDDVNAMRTTCAPHCEPARVDAARRDAIIANVALGTGAAALGVAVVLVITGQPEAPAPTKKAGRAAPLLHAGIAPLSDGAGVLLGGQF